MKGGDFSRIGGGFAGAATIALPTITTVATVDGMSNDSDQAQSLLPLPPATFHILIALLDEERHGYAVIQDVEARTAGRLKMSAGTLYRSIARMVEQGLIAEVDKRRLAIVDERRRTYRLTPFGTAVARAELRRLADLVRMARARGLTPETT
jgi:DNA-binding PadR family transcriptional regulator